MSGVYSFFMLSPEASRFPRETYVTARQRQERDRHHLSQSVVEQASRTIAEFSGSATPQEVFNLKNRR